MEDQNLIRDQMEKTRSALSEKLETLEDRVTTTVQGASEEVAQTVENVTESVQDTVESVKDTIEETLTTVKDSLGAVKSMFDLPQHVDRYPWVCVSGSVAIGFMLGECLQSLRGRRQPAVTRAPLADRFASAPPSTNGSSNGHARVTESPAAKPGLLEKLEPELAKLKGLALGALMGMVREIVTKNVRPNLEQSLSDIIDSVTEKIGGTPVAHEDKEKAADEMELAAATT